MAGVRLRERLRWSEAEFQKLPLPKVAQLSNHRIVFNKPDEQVPGTGSANIVPDSGGKVEGVLYTLSKEQIHFLDKREHGYVRKTEKVSVDGATLDAEVYVAESADDNLKPNPHAVNDVICGAKENGLSAHYISQLEATMT